MAWGDPTGPASQTPIRFDHEPGKVRFGVASEVFRDGGSGSTRPKATAATSTYTTIVWNRCIMFAKMKT